MPKVFYNGSIATFRGRIGNLIFRQLPDGTTVVSHAPPKETGRRKKRAKEKRSPRQKEHNERFGKAARYGRGAQVHPVYVELAAAEPMKTAYNFAVKDGFHPPEVHRLERQNGRILVEATDNIMVARVRITILDHDGKILEQGEAVRSAEDCWEFAPQIEGANIRAEAWDLAKHVAKLFMEQ